MASDFCLVCEESELLIPRESKKRTRFNVSIENPVADEDVSQVQFPIRQLESPRSPVMSAESQETILKASDHVTGISEGSSISESPSSDLGYGSVSSLPCPSQQTARCGISSQVRKSQESKSVCSQSSGSDGPVCRICHDGEDKEQLISPCHCTGSVGMLHLSCLERWLGTSHTTRCELCRYEFMLEKTTPPLSEFFKSPPHPNHGLNTICDISCFFVLTPVSMISAYLCIKGALRYAQWPGSWQMQGLILLTTCLIVIYLTWLGVALHYHITTFQTWRLKHQMVKITSNKSVNGKPVFQTLKRKKIVKQNPSPSSHRSDANQQSNELNEAMLLFHPVLKYSTSLHATKWETDMESGSRLENTAEMTYQADCMDKTMTTSAKEHSSALDIKFETYV